MPVLLYNMKIILMKDFHYDNVNAVDPPSSPTDFKKIMELASGLEA